MTAATDQLFSATGLVAALCYGVGLVALLWVVRRTIWRQRRRSREPRPAEQRQQARRARAGIAEVESRHWWRRYQRAMKFQRGRPLSAAEQAWLAALGSARGGGRSG